MTTPRCAVAAEKERDQFAAEVERLKRHIAHKDSDIACAENYGQKVQRELVAAEASNTALRTERDQLAAEIELLDQAVITANRLVEAAHADRRKAEASNTALRAALDRGEANAKARLVELMQLHLDQKTALRALLHRARTVVDLSGAHPFLVIDIDAALGEGEAGE